MARRQWPLLVAMPLLAALLAYGLARAHPRVYAAHALLSYTNEGPGVGATIPGVTPDEVAAAKAASLTQGTFLQGVRSTLPGRPSLARLEHDLSATVDPRTDVIVIEGRGHTPTQAAALANGLARAARRAETLRERSRFGAAAKGLLTQTGAVAQSIDPADSTALAARSELLSTLATPAEIVQRATPDDSPVAPHPVRIGLAALLLALPLAALAALVRDRVDPRLRESVEIRRHLDLPVLAQIPAVPGGGDDPEPFRILRVNLAGLSPGAPAGVVAVTSPRPEEGRTSVALALARSLAAAGRRTIVLDCDLRHPTVAERLGLPEGPGLREVVLDGLSFDDVVRRVAVPPQPGRSWVEEPELACVTAGHDPRAARDAFDSDPFRALVAAARDRYEVVVLDSAALLGAADARMVVPQADAVLVCVRASLSERDDAEAARAALALLPPRRAGLVVIGAEDDVAAPAYGYYGTGPTPGPAGVLVPSHDA